MEEHILLQMLQGRLGNRGAPIDEKRVIFQRIKDNDLAEIRDRYLEIDREMPEEWQRKLKDRLPSLEETNEWIKKNGQRFEHLLNSGLPEWAIQLPPHLSLPKDSIEQLEVLRKRIKYPEDSFLFHVVGHPEISTRTMLVLYLTALQQSPQSSENELFSEVIKQNCIMIATSRGDVKIVQKMFGIDLESSFLESDLSKIAAKFTSLRELIKWILRIEEKFEEGKIETTPEMVEPANEISSILKEANRPIFDNIEGNRASGCFGVALFFSLLGSNVF